MNETVDSSAENSSPWDHPGDRMEVAKKRQQWAEILFRQAKDWLTERGRKTAGSVEHGLEYARSAAEQAAGKGAEYSRRLNPFHRELKRRFFGIL